MTVDLVVKDCRVVYPQVEVDASIVIDEGKIVALTKLPPPASDRVIDAGSRFVLPGMIDMHVHLRDPGFPEREDFESGTRAAAAGGVTTVVDMPNTVPATVTVGALKQKIEIADRKSLVDFAFIGGAGELTPEALISLAEAGVVGYKSFLIARFRELAASDWQLMRNFETIAKTGLPCLVHAENGDIVQKGIEEARALGRTDPIAHCEFRPPIAEAEATMRTIMLAEPSGVHLHVCHISAKEAVDIVEWAQMRGQTVSGETSPNYLLLTEDAMRERGPYAKVDPPLRTKEDQERLWEAINSGVIDILASDHAPYTKEEKERGWEDIFDAPSGGVVVETSLPLMLNEVDEGRITLNRLTEIFSTNPAILTGLYPKKGSITVGADADLVIVDMDKEFTIRGEDLHTIQKMTAFEGMRGRGAPVMTILRGEVVMEEGDVLGDPGRGEFQRPIC